eukprot:SAG31_NODE_26975_length_433_cov_0.928144_1_plen_35_part_10
MTLHTTCSSSVHVRHGCQPGPRRLPPLLLLLLLLM